MAGPWQTSLPNLITVSRIFFVPLILAALWNTHPWGGYLSGFLFILASITDYFDGWMARKFKVESLLGKFLDPIADKILVTSTLVMMIPARDVHPVLVILLISRDNLINGLRTVAASENLIISAGSLGKWKTALQMFAIPAILIQDDLGPLPTELLGRWGLWLSVILSSISGLQYIQSFISKRNRP